MNNKNIKSKTFLNDFQDELIRRIKVINIIKSYKKNLIKAKAPNYTVRLPKLLQNHSHKNIFFEKIDNINSLKIKHRDNFRETKTFFEDPTNLGEKNKKKNLTARRIVTIEKKIGLNNISNRNHRNKNYINSKIPKNTFSCISNSNTAENIYSNNRMRIYKIKNFENNKNLVDDFNKVNNEYFVMKKNYYVRKNNINKDIFNLLNIDNSSLFHQTMTKNQKQ